MIVGFCVVSILYRIPWVFATLESHRPALRSFDDGNIHLKIHRGWTSSATSSNRIESAFECRLPSSLYGCELYLVSMPLPIDVTTSRSPPNRLTVLGSSFITEFPLGNYFIISGGLRYFLMLNHIFNPLRKPFRSHILTRT